jgi:hypothetical protein
MAMQKTAVGAAFLVAAVLLTATTLAILQSSKTISNSGNIKTINVSAYQDSNCTIPLSAFNWGNMEPNSSAVQTMYIKNEGSAPMTLNMTTNTWNPTNASTYITVTWNQENTIVNPGINVQANVTLTVSPSIAGIPSYTFTMVIKGTG